MIAFTPMPTRLETPRLILRTWAPADAGVLAELLNEREGDTVHTAEECLAFFERQIGTYAEDGFALYPIQRREEGDFIGYCGLIRGRATAEEPEIAYELLKRAHGNGYATEAARAVVDAVPATGRTRLWSTVGDWNTPSLRVLEKLAFTTDRVTPNERGGRGDVVWLRRDLG